LSVCYPKAVRKADAIDANLVLSIVEPISGRVARLTLALDDRLTDRYVLHVQGAGVDQNQPSGLARSLYVYDASSPDIVSGSGVG